MAPPTGDVPSALVLECPECGEETSHLVLKGRASASTSAHVLDALVECEECGHKRSVVLREAADVDLAIVVSRGADSRRTSLPVPGDDEIAVEDLLIVDGRNVKVTGVEGKDGLRHEALRAADVGTLWVKDVEEPVVKFTINLGQKTITKELPMSAGQEVRIGEELTFDRLRVTVHAIKVEGRMLRRGSAEASEIVRAFARPTRPDEKPYRPPKAVREREARRARERGAEGGAPQRSPGRPPRQPGGASGGGARGRRS